MRKALLILGICIVAAPAWAGGGFSLFGSYAQLSDDAEGIGFGARLSVGGDHWIGDLTWTWYPSDEGVLTVPGVDPDKLQVIPTDLGFRYLFQSSGMVRPYIGGGGTFFYNNLSNGSIDNSWGLYGLFGFNFGHGGIKFFAEGIYRWAETDVSYSVGGEPVYTADFDIGGYGINAGVLLSF
jgi:hypothetical protein